MGNMGTNIKIIISDKNLIFRKGLLFLIKCQNDMELVGAAQDGKTTLQIAEHLAPDIVIMDANLPDLNSVDVIEQLIARLPQVKIIVLSEYLDKQVVMEIFEAGTAGYLLKSCLSEDLAQAIRTVMDNKIYLSIEAAGLMLGDFLNQSGTQGTPAFLMLTEEEQEILQLLALEKSTEQIALNLNINEITVESHCRQIKNKLNVR